MLPTFSKDHSRCGVKEGVPGAKGRKEGETGWEAAVGLGGR